MSNTRVKFGSRLPTFNQLKEEFPLSEELKAQILAQRKSVENILDGKDQRVLLIVGPCSVHNFDETIAYAKLLASWAKQHQDKALVLMRVCCDKPRTKKDWRGIFTDPDLNGTHDLAKGLRLSRELMVQVASLGLPVACEALTPSNFHVVSDVVSYAWVGARTGNTPDVREMTSGLSMPVGIKNSNESDSLATTINAIDFARHPSVFANPNDDGEMSVVSTSGNAYSHLILRGNASGPNYDLAHQASAVNALTKAGLNPRLVIDVSHGNCNKDYAKQTHVLKDLALAHDSHLAGVMVESYLEAGKQDGSKLGTPEGLKNLQAGLSVTDGCLSWKQTAEALEAFLAKW
ncbi:MAG: 3-deoxy-7-phosphoheptulonate synthase [bacterium]